VGSPRDIYDRPAERFVANFIGETNFLEGSLVSSAKGVAKVALASGAAITAGVPEGFAPNGKVTVVVRPEHADIVKPGKGATVSGKLENIVYFGTDTHFHVKLKDAGEFIVRRQNAHVTNDDLAAGMEVGVLFEKGAAQVLRD
jgi:spermidine/putrescine transport system ATP-binding protein